MDLGKLDSVKASNEGAWMDVLHPVTNIPTDAKIELYGPDSDLVQRLRREQAERAFAELRGSRRKRIDQEKIEREGLEFLARITKSWKGVEEHGQVLEFSFENALRMYRCYPWLRQQVDDFAGDRNHFLTG